MTVRAWLWPGFMIALVAANLLLGSANLVLHDSVVRHRALFSLRQEELRALHSSGAGAGHAVKTTQGVLARVYQRAIPATSLPRIISRIDSLLAGKSLYRDEALYRKVERRGTLEVIRIDFSLSGSYEHFRQGLEEIERDENLLWPTSIQVFQDKATLRFRLSVDVLVKPS